jgi:hypothetical protein
MPQLIRSASTGATIALPAALGLWALIALLVF